MSELKPRGSEHEAGRLQDGQDGGQDGGPDGGQDGAHGVSRNMSLRHRQSLVSEQAARLIGRPCVP